MDGTTLQHYARDRAGELPHTTMGYPFGPDHEVYKIRGKVFMLLTDVTGEPIVTLKSSPEEATALRDAYEEISPGYHMNKRHWITVSPGKALDKELINDLVTESYLLVIEKNLPQYQHPVDPRTFGQEHSPSA
ncbi:MmcQ/YjbR family DNA-binding protein [Yaniella halotolerans]|uniref:MmcQ/YjbR family DNA-binding protein n=1 Tax=Yaniella halotolerans TaxID=225453 RepID=UPI0003B66490|nr:MmcQ/YjbR family DNA-binding protein [Yaniella halotolerans]